MQQGGSEMDEYGGYGGQQRPPPGPSIRPMVDPEAAGEVDPTRLVDLQYLTHLHRLQHAVCYDSRDAMYITF